MYGMFVGLRAAALWCVFTKHVSVLGSGTKLQNVYRTSINLAIFTNVQEVFFRAH